MIFICWFCQGLQSFLIVSINKTIIYFSYHDIFCVYWSKYNDGSNFINSTISFALMRYRLTCLLQSDILEGFSKVLPNSHFWNDGIKINWSKTFIIFLLIVWNVNSLKLWMNYFWNNLNNMSTIPSFLKQEFYKINLSRISLCLKLMRT